MTDNNIEGTAKEIGGKLKDAVGSVTGDSKTQAEGKVDTAVGKTQQALGDAKDSLSSAASEAGDTIGGVARRVSSQASELGEEAYDQGARAARYVGSQLRDQPLTAMIVAATFGVLVGYLLGRPSHERAVHLGRARIAYRD